MGLVIRFLCNLLMVLFSYLFSINWWGQFHLLTNLLHVHKLNSLAFYVIPMELHSVLLRFVFGFRIVIGLLCPRRGGGYGITNMLTTFFSECSLNCILEKNTVTSAYIEIRGWETSHSYEAECLHVYHD